MTSDRLAKLAFRLACLRAKYVAGAATVSYNLFPYPEALSAARDLKVALIYKNERLLWSHFKYAQSDPVAVHSPNSIAPGLTLESGFADGDSHSVKSSTKQAMLFIPECLIGMNCGRTQSMFRSQ